MATSVTQAFVFGQVSVAAAGTAQPLSATELLVHSVIIRAHSDNSGQIFYGGSDVDSGTQMGLDANQEVKLENPEGPFDLASIYVDAGSNDDGVDFVAARA